MSWWKSSHCGKTQFFVQKFCWYTFSSKLNCLFTVSADCLHFYADFCCLFTFSVNWLRLFTISVQNSAVYIHFQLFVYILSSKFSYLFTFSDVCLHFSTNFCWFFTIFVKNSAVYCHFQLFVYIFLLISDGYLHFPFKSQLFI